MSNKNRKLLENKKPESNFKTWLVGALTDLTIGIILLILDRLLN